MPVHEPMEAVAVPATPTRGAHVAAVARTAPDAGTPTPTQAWTPDLSGVLSIHVDSAGSAPRDAWGEASNRGVFPFSGRGRVEHFCSTPATYPVRIRFYVDALALPRPTPFRPPSLSVAVAFTPTGGASRPVASGADAAPRYHGPGWPLTPSFGDLFSAVSSASGVLAVTARLADTDAGVTLTYTDDIACELVPCA